jgi:flagellin
LERNAQAGANASTRLATGYRVNSAQDDAAGLQIATRLKAQASGMNAALRNIQNDISMLQTADGAIASAINNIARMNELAIQAADATSTQTDRVALDAEFMAQYEQMFSVTRDTEYDG